LLFIVQYNVNESVWNGNEMREGENVWMRNEICCLNNQSVVSQTISNLIYQS